MFCSTMLLVVNMSNCRKCNIFKILLFEFWEWLGKAAFFSHTVVSLDASNPQNIKIVKVWYNAVAYFKSVASGSYNSFTKINFDSKCSYDSFP